MTRRLGVEGDMGQSRHGVFAGRQLSLREAAVVQFASKYTNVAVSLVVTMVLARLITPEQFGSVAIVTVFTSFFSLFSDMGISTGIVQRKDLSDEDFSGLFLFSVAASTVLAAMFALLSVPAGIVYGGADAGQRGLMTSLFLVSSVGVFFSALNTVPNGILRRRKLFLDIAVRLVAVNVITGCAAVALAFAGAGCYALVAHFVLSSVLTFACNFAIAGVRVRRAPVMRPLWAIWSFSFFQFAHGFVNYFSRNMDNLLAGAAFGSAALGYYDRAYRLSIYPVSGFTSVVASVLHPYLSDRQGCQDEIYDRFVRLTQAIFAVGIPASACMLAASREVVWVLFGAQWDASAPLLAALSVSVMFQMCTSLTGAFFQSLGDTWDMFLSAVVNTTITLAAICASAASGNLLVLAVMVSAAWCVNPVATYYYLVVRAFRRTLVGFAHAMAPQLAVAGTMVALGAVLRAIGDTWWPGPAGLATFATLALKLVLCCVTYGALLAMTGQWRHLSVLVGERRR